MKDKMYREDEMGPKMPPKTSAMPSRGPVRPAMTKPMKPIMTKPMKPGRPSGMPMRPMPATKVNAKLEAIRRKRDKK